MKLFTFPPAPNAQRVQMFLYEKKIELDLVELNVRDGEQFKKPFKNMNPFGCIPFLKLEDDTIISETVSICRYLEDLFPEPYLFGKSAKERALIDMWNRRLELDGFLPLLHSIRNSSPRFTGRVIPGTRSELPQLSSMAERGIEMFEVLLNRISPQLETNEYIAGADFSIADITGCYMMDLSKLVDLDIENKHPNIFAWHDRIRKRKSHKNV